MKDCFNCDNAVNVGEGASFCDIAKGVVIEDYSIPTDKFNCCNSKEFKEAEALNNLLYENSSMHNPTWAQSMSIFILLKHLKEPTEDELITVGAAIKNVLEMPTHNSITKKDMLNAIRFLWNQIYEFTEEDKEC